MIVNRFLTFVMLCAYIVVYGAFTTYIRREGYLNFEPLFIAHNFILSYRTDVNHVLQFFFSSPFIAHLLSSPFTLINTLDAPFYACIIGTSVFNTSIVNKVSKGKYTVFSWVVFLFLMLSPIHVYAACSGTSFYIYLITLSFLFYFIFNYIKKYTTYHLTWISLMISVIVFLDYKLLWVVLLIVPLLFLFTIKNTPGVKDNLITQFIRISQNVSLRRKLIGRFSSMIVIISFFPFSLFFIYLLINDLYTGDYFFFLKSNSTHWNSYGLTDLGGVAHETRMRLQSFNSLAYIKLMLLVTPLCVYELFIESTHKIKSVVFLMAPLLVFVLGSNAKINVVNLNYFIVFHALALGSLTALYYRNIEHNKWPKQFLYGLVFGLSIFTSYLYFTKTIHASERIFSNRVLKNKNNELLVEMKRASAFMKHQILPEKKILCDFAVFYPLLAFDANQHAFINNLSDDFIEGLRAPRDVANYLLISKETSPFYANDKLVIHVQKKLAIKDDALLSRIVYEGNFFKIIRLK